MQLVASRRGAEDLEAVLRDLTEGATSVRGAVTRRGDDVAALRSALRQVRDRVVVDQAVDLLRNLRQAWSEASGLLSSLQQCGLDEVVEGGAALAGPAVALTLSLSAAEHALAPLATAVPTRSNVELVGGVSVGMCERFVAIVDGSARELAELLALALGAATARPAGRGTTRLRVVP